MDLRKASCVTCGSVLGTLLVATTTFDSVAAPPTPAPMVADVAYISVTTGCCVGAWWKPAAVRGMGLDASGRPTGDAEMWRSTDRYVSAIAWDPSGRYLIWAQVVDRKGTRGLVTATPGQTPRTIVPFSFTGLYFANKVDGIAAGPGCGSTPVVYFWGIQSPTNWPTVWVVDPSATSPQPRQLYAFDVPPPDDDGGSLHGMAVSPLGRTLVVGAYSSALGSKAAVALPLRCPTANSLPEPAGPPQPLFAARYEEDLAEIQSFDWSRDGRRLAVSMARRVPNAGGALIYPAELWVAELDYSAVDGQEQVNLASLSHLPAGVGAFPSWGPSSDTAACDRLAFVRGGATWLVDVPRAGFQPGDCSIATPAAIGGVGVGALDWK